MRQALVVVAKAPIPGTVKVELCPPLTPQSAADLYTCFLRDVLALAASLEETDVTVLYPRQGGSAHWLRALAPSAFRLRPERGRGVSCSLAYACRSHFRRGYRKVALTSPDTPTLPRRFLEEAFRRLNVHDVVLGPCLDGSYYLIALRGFYPGLFAGVDWGGHRGLSQIVERARDLGLSVSLLPSWYHVDTATDLDRLLREARSLRNGQARHTRSFFGLCGEDSRHRGEPETAE